MVIWALTHWKGERNGRKMGGDITQEMIRRRSEHNECVLYTMEVHSWTHIDASNASMHFQVCLLFFIAIEYNNLTLIGVYW